MPVAYSIDCERRVVFMEASGVLTDEEIQDYQARVQEDPSFARDLRQVVDCRSIVKLCVTSEGIRDASRRSPFSKGSRRAIVAGDDLAFGLARMFEMLHDGVSGDTRVFRDREQAELWLGLAAPCAPSAVCVAASSFAPPPEDDFRS